VLAVLAGLVLLGLVAGALGPRLYVSYQLHAARRALEHFDFDQAQEHLDACLDVRPQQADVRALAAQVARRRGAYDQAKEHLAAWDHLAGAGAALILERRLLDLQRGELEVVPTLRASPEGNDPDNVVLILEALTQGYASSHYLPEALHAVNQLLDREPAHAPALCWRGMIWERFAQDDKALADYQRAVELAPRLAEARMQLAATLYRLGHPWEAANQYEVVRAVQPDAPDVLLGLARCRYDLAQGEEARQRLDQLLASHPDHVPTLVERAGIDLRAGQADPAERWLRRAVAGAPQDYQVYRLLRQSLEAQGKTADLEACLARLKEIETERARVSILIAQALESPADAAQRCAIGVSLFRAGREEEALPWLFSAVKVDPRRAPAHFALADYFRRHGQPDRAARHQRLATASGKSVTP
jgi:tetratricopeptide (TPR) repeat protein